MRPGAQLAIAALMTGCIAAPGAQAQPPAPALPRAQDLDQLLERFHGSVPGPEGSVSLEARVESGAGGRREVVIMLEPEGEAKLIADPGITVEPVLRSGIEWAVPLPHRHVDSTIEYFAAPAAVRLPFTAADGLPVELRVEYAWCLVDYQCFFGEETLHVVNRVE